MPRPPPVFTFLPLLYLTRGLKLRNQEMAARFAMYNLPHKANQSRNRMPARDIYHHQVRTALIKDGWTITHDPLRLIWGRKDVFVDLGAERLLAAEKGSQRIAVEIKSFLGTSEIQDLEHALGQFVLYRTILAQREPDRQLYLAVPSTILHTVFQATHRPTAPA